MSQIDFDFTAPQATKTKKVDYKVTMLRPQTGDNILRFYDLSRSKSAEIHWIKYPKLQSARCPGAGCPLCEAKFFQEMSYFTKVIDRATESLKAFEFNIHLCEQIQQVKAEFEATHKVDGQRFADQNFNVRRSFVGGRVQLNLLMSPPPSVTQLNTDGELIKTDTLDLAVIAKPWDVAGLTRFLQEHPENLRGRQ